MFERSAINNKVYNGMLNFLLCDAINEITIVSNADSSSEFTIYPCAFDNGYTIIFGIHDNKIQ